MSWHIYINYRQKKGKTMRSKDTGNGRKILAKVEVPLSVDDIATYALRYLDEAGDDDPKDTLLNANKRQIFKQVIQNCVKSSFTFAIIIN